TFASERAVMKRSMLLLAGAILIAALSSPRADEGMWTFNNFPADAVEKAYGFRPNQQWLDHVRLSSVRLAPDGCSGSFVSGRALVQTNQHCVRDCVAQRSTDSVDMAVNGFYAREEKDEIQCPDMEINQLIEIVAVTDRVRLAASGKEGDAWIDALND